jgi:hypothetical protein
MLSKINGYNPTSNNYKSKMKVQNKSVTFGMELVKSEEVLESLVGKSKVKEMLDFIDNLNLPANMKSRFQKAMESFRLSSFLDELNPEKFVSGYPDRQISIESTGLSVYLKDQFSKNYEGCSTLVKDLDPVVSAKTAISEALDGYAKSKISDEILGRFMPVRTKYGAL